MPSAIPYFLCQCQKTIILKSEIKVPRMSTQCTVQPLLMIRNHHPWEIAGLIPIWHILDSTSKGPTHIGTVRRLYGNPFSVRIGRDTASLFHHCRLDKSALLRSSASKPEWNVPVPSCDVIDMAKQNRRITVWAIHSYSLDLKVLVIETLQSENMSYYRSCEYECYRKLSCPPPPGCRSPSSRASSPSFFLRLADFISGSSTIFHLCPS